MKRFFVCFVILTMIFTFSSHVIADQQPDHGYDLIVSLLSDKLGFPSEYIDDSDMFAALDKKNFNTRNCSAFVVIDLQKCNVLVGGKLSGKSAKISTWENQSYSALVDSGLVLLSNYKEINSASSERFALAVYNGNDSLCVDSVAEVNSGLKKYGSLFPTEGGTAVSTVPTTSAAAIAEPTEAPSGSAEPSSLFLIEGKNGYGYCNAEGEVVIPCQWYEAESFTYGLTIVRKEKGGNRGCIDMNGNLVIPCSFAEIHFRNGGYVIAINYINNRYGRNAYSFFYPDGKPLEIPSNIKLPESNVDINFPYLVYIDGKKNLHIYNLTTKKEVLSRNWDRLIGIQDEMICVSTGFGVADEYGFISMDGKTLFTIDAKKYDLEKSYAYVSFISEGLITVEDDSYAKGFIDKRGNLVIPCVWRSAFTHVFSEGLAVVTKERETGPFGYIDITGNLVIPLSYEWADSFHEGLAAVEDENSLIGFIDKEGNQVIDCLFSLNNLWLSSFNNGDLTNKEESGFKNGYCLVKYNEQKFYIDRNGTPAFPYIEGGTLPSIEILYAGKEAKEERSRRDEIINNAPLIPDFTLHSGTYFGLTVDEVIAKEKERKFSPSRTSLFYTFYDELGNYKKAKTSAITLFGSMAGISGSKLDYYFDKGGKLFAAVYKFGDHDPSSYATIQGALSNKYSNVWHSTAKFEYPTILDCYFEDIPKYKVYYVDLHYIDISETHRVYICHALVYPTVAGYSDVENLIFGGAHFLEYRLVSNVELEDIAAAKEAKIVREQELEVQHEQQREQELMDDL